MQVLSVTGCASSVYCCLHASQSKDGTMQCSYHDDPLSRFVSTGCCWLTQSRQHQLKNSQIPRILHMGSKSTTNSFHEVQYLHTLQYETKALTPMTNSNLVRQRASNRNRSPNLQLVHCALMSQKSHTATVTAHVASSNMSHGLYGALQLHGQPSLAHPGRETLHLWSMQDLNKHVWLLLTSLLCTELLSAFVRTT
jgi:hypothetical protein